MAQSISNGWLSARPTDQIAAIVHSDGDSIAHVGTGLAQVFSRDFPDAQDIERRGDGPRRILWISHSQRSAMIDLAEAATWPGNSDPRGSSSFLAHDLLFLADLGISYVHIHLPVLMSNTDLGIGLLSGLSHITLAYNSSIDVLSNALHKARSALGTMALYVTYPHDQDLLGLAGLARTWQRSGLDPNLAHLINKDMATFAHNLDQAAQVRSSSLLNAEPTLTFEGVGGGLGKIFYLLKAKLDLIGQNLVLPPEADIYIYVTDHLELNVPRGLQVVAEHAESLGVPVVLVAAHTQLVRGELPGLGVHGLYRLPTESEPFHTQGLEELGARLASTWGWDT
ncbi:hypothetical protein [Arcanobacterium buesumense]|uniref:Glycerate kinase n=1 Tax=Arcanobacterium buesumense TaxID=2722751 RepID=A0A6H2EJC8_9ACTO|nr:hypothetical protein [Arcanobacterium buesumense]QJC21668.1 hypothetical protein HC352_03550 [Arcanobacterium buesumense]